MTHVSAYAIATFWVEAAAAQSPEPANVMGNGERSRFRDPALQADQARRPRGHSPLADMIPADEIRSQLRRMHTVIRHGAEVLPNHADFLTRAGTGVASRAVESERGKDSWYPEEFC